MIVCDTSAVLAAYGHDEVRREEVLRTLKGEAEPLIMSPFVLGELDYLVASRANVEAELRVLDDVANGAYSLAEFTRHDVAQAADVVRQYRDLNVGLADASIVVLAARYNTTRVLTFDQRHFRAMKPLGGGSFTVLPADSPAGPN